MKQYKRAARVQDMCPGHEFVNSSAESARLFCIVAKG